LLEMHTDPFADAELLVTLGRYSGAGDDADQDDPLRFMRGVARLVKKRSAVEEGDVRALAVFLLNPGQPPSSVAEKLEDCPMLDNGLTNVEGRLWLVSPVVVSGKALEIESLTDSAIFEYVTKSLGMGGAAAVIYDPRTSPTEIRYYPNGLAVADDCTVVEVTAPDVRMGAVLAVIDRIYAAKLVTPNAQNSVAKLWERPSVYWPVEKAELTIQMYLETGLNGAFPTCTIRCEQSQVSGRLDLEIEEPDPSRPGYVIRHVVLELKVLRSFGSGGASYSPAQNRRAIKEGMEQAYAYKSERDALDCALCCFDMRQSHANDSCFDHVRSDAARLKVTLKVWNIYAKLTEYRAATAKAASG
jgi:hypothetical protein